MSPRKGALLVFTILIIIIIISSKISVMRIMVTIFDEKYNLMI